MLHIFVEDPGRNRARRSRGAETEMRRSTRRTRTASTLTKGKTRRGRVPPRGTRRQRRGRVVEQPWVVGSAAKVSLVHDEGERAEGEDQEVARIPQAAQKAHYASCEASRKPPRVRPRGEGSTGTPAKSSSTPRRSIGTTQTAKHTASKWSVTVAPFALPVTPESPGPFEGIPHRVTSLTPACRTTSTSSPSWAASFSRLQHQKAVLDD